jgi:hypothetical protein
MTAGTDTAPEVAARYRAMLLARSESDRVVMALGMFSTAQALVLSTLPADASEAARRTHLFNRLYGNDFDAMTAARIIDRLSSSCLP